MMGNIIDANLLNVHPRIKVDKTKNQDTTLNGQYILRAKISTRRQKKREDEMKDEDRESKTRDMFILAIAYNFSRSTFENQFVFTLRRCTDSVDSKVKVDFTKLYSTYKIF